MEFWKMNGAGNDFIVIDNRPLHYSQQQLADLARTVCHRHLSIGADGLMAVDTPQAGGDYRMLFFMAPAASAATALKPAWPVRPSGSRQRQASSLASGSTGSNTASA